MLHRHLIRRWLWDPGISDGSGLGWGHRETFNRFNHRESLSSGIVRWDFCWLTNINTHVAYCYATSCIEGMRFFGLHTVCITEELHRVEGAPAARVSVLDESAHQPQVDPKHWLGQTVDWLRSRDSLPRPVLASLLLFRLFCCWEGLPSEMTNAF